MPRNNPYDRELTGWRKKLSTIGFILTEVVVFGFIIYMLLREPANVRTDFGPVSTPISVSAQSGEAVTPGEFRRFATEVGDPIGFGPDFKESYPTVAVLLSMDTSVHTENKPYIIDDGGCVALALSYNHIVDEEAVRLDLVLLPYATQGETLTFLAPERYTFSYDVATGVIQSELLRTQNFRLSFYNITVEYDRKLNVDYTMKLFGLISDREAEMAKLHSCVSGSGGASGTLRRLENESELFGTLADTDKVTVTFGDLLYDTFEQITLPLPEGSSLQVGFN